MKWFETARRPKWDMDTTIMRPEGTKRYNIIISIAPEGDVMVEWEGFNPQDCIDSFKAWLYDEDERDENSGVIFRTIMVSDCGSPPAPFTFRTDWVSGFRVA